MLAELQTQCVPTIVRNLNSLPLTLKQAPHFFPLKKKCQNPFLAILQLIADDFPTHIYTYVFVHMVQLNLNLTFTHV